MASVLSVTGFLQSAAPIASAEPEVSFPSLPETEANLAYSDNTFGSMVAREINLERARLGATAVVHDVVLNEGIAQVSLESASDATAVVCVFSDPSGRNAPKLLGTGMQAFTADETLIDVPVSLSSMPEYYLVRVYVVGENQVPLSMEYTDSMHTSMMQEVLQSEISDYEGYEVLNLDENDDTNFAVYNKEVQVLHSDGTHDIVLNQDLENGIYLIRNYTGEIKKGSVVAIDGANHGAAVFKISSLETDGDVTTVHADLSYNTDDAFEFVKLETDASNNTLTLTPPDPEESYGHEFTYYYDDEEQPAQGRPARGGMSAASAEEDEDDFVNSSDSVHFRVQFGKGVQTVSEEAGVDLSGFADFIFDYKVSFYKSNFFSTLHLDMALSVEIGAEINVAFEMKFPLPYSVVFNPVSCVKLELGPYIDVSITGQVDISTVFSASFGSGKKFTYNASVTDLKLTVEGFIGIGIGGEMCFLDKKGELSVLVGLQVDVQLNSPHKGCGLCSNITLSLVGKLNAKLDVGFIDVGIEPKIELEFGKCYASDNLGFGWGECPNLSGNGSQDPDDPDDPDDPAELPPESGDDGLNAEQRVWYDFVKLEDGYGLTMKDPRRIIHAYLPDMPTYYKGDPVVEIMPEAFSTISFIHNIKLPGKIKRIGNRAFSTNDPVHWGSSIVQSSIYFPETLEYIGEHAFSNAEISSLKFPKSLKTLGDYAFSGSSLNSLTVPLSVENYGKGVFGGGDMETIYIQDGITKIEPYMFANCYNLKHVYIPDTVTEIEDHAFYGCRECDIELPRNLKKIGDFAFNTDHYVPVADRDKPQCAPYDMTVPSSVSEIGICAFGTRKMIRRFTLETGIPQGVGIGMFDHQEEFSQLYENACMREFYFPRNWTSIPDRFFNGIPVNYVKLPPNLRSIGEYAFRKSGLKQIKIPNTVTTIGKGAFYQCTLLNKVTMPQSLKAIADDTFYENESLRSLTIPDQVKSIGENAFYECCALATIVLPKSVESVYFNAFSDYHEGDLYPNGEAIITVNEDGSTTRSQPLKYSERRKIYFFNPNTQFLGDPEKLAADYIPENGYRPLIDYNFLTIYGFTGSTAESFAKDPSHTCAFISMTPNQTVPTNQQPVVIETNQTLTKTFTGLKPNTVYNFYDLLGTEFTAANLLYLSQGISDENGTLTVWYRPAKSVANSQQFVRCMEPDVSETTASVTTTGNAATTTTAKVTTTTAKVTTTTAKVTTTTAKVTTTTAKVTTTTKTNTTTTSAATTSSGKTTTTAKTTTSATTPAPISYVKGDISGDFKVDVSDAVLLARFCTEDKNVKISTQGVLNADVDKNGNADSDDLVMILQYIARIINKFA